MTMKTSSMRHSLSILAAGVIAIVMTACVSPLDSDAPRKETPITPAIKVDARSVDAAFTTPAGTYRIKGQPVFRFDTTVVPIRCWIDVTMEAVVDTGTGPMLHEFRIRLDSFPGNGLVTELAGSQCTFTADLGNGVQNYPPSASNSCEIIVAEHERAQGGPRKVSINILIDMNKDGFFTSVGQEQVLGQIDLIL
jgi:hypothetical protein